MKNRIIYLLAGLLLSAGALAANPVVVMETTLGTITLELYPDKSPKTVANFLAYVDSGFYDGTIFHRVIPGFMAQGGGFTPEFEQKPTRPPVINESNNYLHNERGTIAMARTNDPDSATAQFFINVKTNGNLDYFAGNWGYTVFGQVTKGMDVVDTIVHQPTGPGGPFRTDVPQTAVLINKAYRQVTPSE